jgi:CRP/FNR family transcriptional regulator, dissimilatory nitrate respiration regulator
LLCAIYNVCMKKLQPHTPNNTISHPLFEASPELWVNVAVTLRKKIYENDDRIVSHGDAAGSLWLVLKGWVKLTRQTPDGKESIIGLCTDGDVFGEAALFPHANYPYTAEVVGSSAELVAIPAVTIRALVAKEPSISARVMVLLNERTSQAQLKLEQMSTMSASQRLGCFLLRLCHSQANGSKAITIPVEKHILAAYLGMKPETLSRSQQQLKPLGISVVGHGITIKNIEKLREFVCNSCSESGSCDVDTSS